ncbi:MAG TPA: hypothetical protein VF852_15135, partial [Pseudolabrys sp.]
GRAVNFLAVLVQDLRSHGRPYAESAGVDNQSRVHSDTRDGDKPKAWLKEVGVQKLAYHADPTARTFQDLKAIGRAFGMPTTLLIDGQGCEIGTIAGPAEWASEDAIKLIKAAVGSQTRAGRSG